MHSDPKSLAAFGPGDAQRSADALSRREKRLRRKDEI